MKAIPVDNLLFYPPDKFLDNSLVFSQRFKSDIIFSTTFGISELF